jgi:hypothetical protein
LEVKVPEGFLTRDNVCKQNYTWSRAHTLIGDHDDTKKYKAATDPLVGEEKLKRMQGWPALAHDYAMAKLEEDVKKLGSDPEKMTPWQTAQILAFGREYIKGKRKSYEQEFHSMFAHRFREWLRGNGSQAEYMEAGMVSYVDDVVGADKTKRCKNTPVSDHPSVLSYLSQWQERVIDYEKKLTLMKLRLGRGGERGEPASIDDLWKYYKFVVYGLGQLPDDEQAPLVANAADTDSDSPPGSGYQTAPGTVVYNDVPHRGTPAQDGDEEDDEGLIDRRDERVAQELQGRIDKVLELNTEMEKQLAESTAAHKELQKDMHELVAELRKGTRNEELATEMKEIFKNAERERLLINEAVVTLKEIPAALERMRAGQPDLLNTPSKEGNATDTEAQIDIDKRTLRAPPIPVTPGVAAIPPPVVDAPPVSIAPKQGPLQQLQNVPLKQQVDEPVAPPPKPASPVKELPRGIHPANIIQGPVPIPPAKPASPVKPAPPSVLRKSLDATGSVLRTSGSLLAAASDLAAKAGTAVASKALDAAASVGSAAANAVLAAVAASATEEEKPIDIDELAKKYNSKGLSITEMTKLGPDLTKVVDRAAELKKTKESEQTAQLAALGIPLGHRGTISKPAAPITNAPKPAPAILKASPVKAVPPPKPDVPPIVQPDERYAYGDKWHTSSQGAIYRDADEQVALQNDAILEDLSRRTGQRVTNDLHYPDALDSKDISDIQKFQAERAVARSDKKNYKEPAEWKDTGKTADGNKADPIDGAKESFEEHVKKWQLSKGNAGKMMTFEQAKKWRDDNSKSNAFYSQVTNAHLKTWLEGLREQRYKSYTTEIQKAVEDGYNLGDMLKNKYTYKSRDPKTKKEKWITAPLFNWRSHVTDKELEKLYYEVTK